MRSEWRDGERVRVVEVTAEGGGRYRVTVDGAVMELTAESLGEDRLRVSGADSATVIELTAAGTRRFVRIGNMDFVLDREAGGRRRARGAQSGGLEAPMPGVVTKVMVAAGDTVTKGQPLLALEAMKMEHVIRSPRAGRIRSITRQGEMVQGGVALVELEEPESA